MSRKASTTFISSDGIEEIVLKHKLKDLFGSEAQYDEAPSGDGWIVQHYSKIAKDYKKRLQSATTLVQNALREKQEILDHERARAHRQPTRTFQDSSNYGNALPRERRLPIRTDSQRNDNEVQRYERLAIRSEAPPEVYQIHPTRHASIAGRQGETARPLTYMNSNTMSPSAPLEQYPVARLDGHSPRWSSLVVNSSPRDIPQSFNRHDASPELKQDRRDTVDETGGSLGRATTRERHAGQGNYGNMDFQTAARDTKRDYVERDFPTIWEWQQYNQERAEHKAKIQQAQRRGVDFSEDESSSDEYSYTEATVPRRSHMAEPKTFKQASSATRHHDDNYHSEDAVRQKAEPNASAQGYSTSRHHDTGYLPEDTGRRRQAQAASSATRRHDRKYFAEDLGSRRVEAKVPRQISNPTRYDDNDEYNDYTDRPSQSQPISAGKHEIMTISRPRDAYDSEAPTVVERTDRKRLQQPSILEYDSDEVIGHKQGTRKRPVVEQNLSKSAKGDTAPILRASANPKSITKARHSDPASTEKPSSVSKQAVVQKAPSKDQENVSTKSGSKFSSRHHRDSNTRGSKPLIQKTQSYHDDDQSSRNDLSYEEEEAVVRPNSKRPREYKVRQHTS